MKNNENKFFTELENQPKDTLLAELFTCILEDDEKIIKTYKPVQKTIRNYFGLFYMLVIPIAGWIALILSWPIIYPFYRAWYKKRAYAVTNKRIIVRGGIIGVDFKFLEYKSINATTVNVGITDKVSKTNTGTITFGSPASPIGMVNANGIVSNPFVFMHIENPYEEHKFIKQIINKATNYCPNTEVPGI